MVLQSHRPAAACRLAEARRRDRHHLHGDARDPGDLAACFAGGAATHEAVEQVRRQLGLVRPRRETGLARLFVSHDLDVVRLLTDRVAAMYLGKIVEMGPSATVYTQPSHPYSKALASAVPGLGQRIRLKGEVQSPIAPPPLSRFRSRCQREAPPFRGNVRAVARHFA